MPKQFMCQWGNCNNTNVAVSVSHKAGLARPKFCCEEHAAAWLMRQARLHHPNGSPGDVALGEIEQAITKANPPVRRI